MSNTEDRINAECLGIRCFNEMKGNENNQYTLIPINEWTEEICNELNKTDFSRKYILENKNSLTPVNNYKDKFKNVNNLNKPVNEVFRYNSLPVEYVRFNNTVIIKKEENDTIVSQIESSIIENLGIVASFDIKKSELLQQDTPITDYNNEEESLKILKDICALSAKFSLNKRPTSGADNHIWYELLQNANDHIPNDSEKELKIYFDDSARTFTLEYPDNGFSVRDFLAICTEGNSGNVLSDENREGRKGTGFKSVYNLFDEVTITSGPVKCVLKDVEKNIEITKDGKINVTDKENANRSEYYYPIPEFSRVNDCCEKKTKITFHRKNDLNIIKNLLFDADGLSEDDFLKAFKKKEDYLFLDNIDKISFSFNNNNLKEFDRGKYIKENYIKKEYTIGSDSTNDSNCAIEKTSNPNWRERTEDLFNKKKKLIFLFPKNIQFPEEASESRVYCTLPIDEFKLKVPFYVNIPLLELKDDRKSLADQEIENFSFKTWNQCVLINGLMNGFKRIVEQDILVDCSKSDESVNNKNIIGLSNWYKYFPYEYLNQDKKVFSNSWECLQEVKFLRATTSTEAGGESVKSAAISDLVQNEDDLQKKEKSIFLPCDMYGWLHKNIDDIFISKEFGDDSSKRPPISFVYYEDDKVNKDTKIIIEDKVKDRISKGTNINFNYSIAYLRKEEGYVGKILLEIKEYLLNDYKKNLESKDAFYLWLKKLLVSSDFNFAYKKTYIYQAYFNVNGVDYKNGKYHWLKTGNECFYNDNYNNYYFSINKNVQELKKKLYDDNETYNLEQEEINSIIYCFDDLVLSPYIKYTYEKENGNGQWKISKELRDSNDSVLPKDTVEVNDNLKKLYCYYTEELLNSNDTEFGEVGSKQGWFKKNNVALYVENTNNKIIPVTEKVYYVDKEKNIISDSVVKCGKQFFVSLEAALDKEGDFFKKNEDNEDNGKFVIQILEAYDVSIWTEQAQKYIENEDTNKDIRSTIFRHLIKESEGPIDWNAAYSELVKDCSIDELWKDGKVAFKFIKDDVNKLSQYVLDIFENKVSIQEKEKTIKTIIGDFMLDKSLQEIVKNDIFVFQCKTGNKSLYCKGRISEENNTQRDIYVLFGENAFGTLLRNVFQCYDFSEYKIYDEMQCNAIDALKGWEEQESEPFGDSIGKKVDDLIDKWKEGKQEEFKRALVTRFEVRNKEAKKWFNARGYGNEEYINRVCPVCKGILLSEMHALTVRNIICTIEEQKYYFPMLMCKNCGDAINYAETVELESSIDGDNDGNPFKVGKNSFEEYNVIFSMNGREKKKLNCKVSFLNRYIWKRIKEKEDENRQGKI